MLAVLIGEFGVEELLRCRHPLIDLARLQLVQSREWDTMHELGGRPLGTNDVFLPVHRHDADFPLHLEIPKLVCPARPCHGSPPFCGESTPTLTCLIVLSILLFFRDKKAPYPKVVRYSSVSVAGSTLRFLGFPADRYGHPHSLPDSEHLGHMQAARSSTRLAPLDGTCSPTICIAST